MSEWEWKTVRADGITVAGGYECPTCKTIYPVMNCPSCKPKEDTMTEQKCKYCKEADAIFKERGGNLLTNHIYMEHCICEPIDRTGKKYEGCPFCEGDKP